VQRPPESEWKEFPVFAETPKLSWPHVRRHTGTLDPSQQAKPDLALWIVINNKVLAFTGACTA
jgi:hypothetical protein